MNKITFPLSVLMILFLVMFVTGSYNAKAIQSEQMNIFSINDETKTTKMVGEQLAPSFSVSSYPLIIQNEQASIIDLTGRFSFVLEREGFSENELREMLDHYYIKIFKNDIPLTAEWQPVKSISQLVQTISSIEGYGQEKIHYDIKLGKEAGNDYQGAQLHVELTLGSHLNLPPAETDENGVPVKPSDTGSGFGSTSEGFKLPDTATSIFYFLAAGLILICAGFLMLLLRNKNISRLLKLYRWN